MLLPLRFLAGDLLLVSGISRNSVWSLLCHGRGFVLLKMLFWPWTPPLDKLFVLLQGKFQTRQRF